MTVELGLLSFPAIRAVQDRIRMAKGNREPWLSYIDVTQEEWDAIKAECQGMCFENIYGQPLSRIDGTRLQIKGKEGYVPPSDPKFWGTL
jgi:hypothetical protein